MFGLISKKKYDNLMQKYHFVLKILDSAEENYQNLNLEFYINAKKNLTIIKELEKSAEELITLRNEIKLELEKLNTFVVEKEISDFQVKEFGQESLKQIEESCVEELLKDVRKKITINKEKNFPIHKIIAKITIQNGN
jgi:hypothetical protein